MFYDAVENDHGLPHDPFKALVAPRPIGWISTVTKDGVVNLAPYSAFNLVCVDPYVVMFSSFGRKDSLTNIEATGEFVCSLATYDLREAVSATAAPVPPDIDELASVGLTPAPSRMVRPPRVKESPAALECRHLQTVEIHDADGAPTDKYMVLGTVVGIFIDDAYIKDGLFDVTAARPLARLGYFDYAAVDEVFSLRMTATLD